MKLLKFNQAGKWNASLPHKVTCLVQEYTAWSTICWCKFHNNTEA